MLNIDYINFNYKFRGTKVVVNVSTTLRKELLVLTSESALSGSAPTKKTNVERIEIMPYAQDVDQITSLLKQHPTWNAINPKHAARMRAQNKFKTGLDIAKYTAKIMREDMANYDNDTAQYTQSLGCWHGFIGQQKMLSIKKHFGSTKRRYL